LSTEVGRRGVLVVGGALLAAGIAATVSGVHGHVDARAAWLAEAARQGRPSYDASASDAAYHRSREAWDRAGLGGRLVGLGALVFLLGIGRERPRSLAAPSAGRLRASHLLDVALTALPLGVLLLDDGESAALHALRLGLPSFAAAPWVALARGASPGMRALRLTATNVGLRALPAALLSPLALLVPTAGWHLRASGVEVHPRADTKQHLT